MNPYVPKGSGLRRWTSEPIDVLEKQRRSTNAMYAMWTDAGRLCFITTLVAERLSVLCPNTQTRKSLSYQRATPQQREISWVTACGPAHVRSLVLKTGRKAVDWRNLPLEGVCLQFACCPGGQIQRQIPVWLLGKSFGESICHFVRCGVGFGK
jgi:hypothetical protein